MQNAVENIVVCGSLFFSDLQWNDTFLPIRVGGLWLYSIIEDALYAFVASMIQSWVLQDHRLRDSEINGMHFDFVIVLEDLSGMILNFDLRCL